MLGTETKQVETPATTMGVNAAAVAAIIRYYCGGNEVRIAREDIKEDDLIIGSTIMSGVFSGEKMIGEYDNGKTKKPYGALGVIDQTQTVGCGRILRSGKDVETGTKIDFCNLPKNYRDWLFTHRTLFQFAKTLKGMKFETVDQKLVEYMGTEQMVNIYDIHE